MWNSGYRVGVRCRRYLQHDIWDQCHDTDSGRLLFTLEPNRHPAFRGWPARDRRRRSYCAPTRPFEWTGPKFHRGAQAFYGIVIARSGAQSVAVIKQHYELTDKRFERFSDIRSEQLCRFGIAGPWAPPKAN